MAAVNAEFLLDKRTGDELEIISSKDKLMCFVI